MLSNYLAEIWGISIVVISLFFLVKDNNMRKLFMAAENDDYLFSYGITSFILGVAMVFAHNIWIINWQVAVTILGWIALLRGIFLLFFPDLARTIIRKVENFPFIPYLLVASIILGLTLTYFGFTA